MDLKHVCGSFRAGVILAGRRFLISGLVAGLAGCGGGGDNNKVEQFPTQPVTIGVLSAVVNPAYQWSESGGALKDFPISEYNDGNFVLRSSAATSDTAALGSSHDTTPPTVRIVQGEYDVLFQHETGNGVPQNVGSSVQSNVVLNSNQALPIEMTAWAVTPSFTLNGLAFPVTEYDDAVFYLRPIGGGGDIFLGNSHSASPGPVLVMQGTYDVIYALETGGEVAPNNQNVAVMRDVNVGADMPLAVNVLAVDFRLSGSLDTVPFPASQYQRAEFFLRNSAGDLVELGDSSELPLTVSVIEGDYDIVYRHVQGDLLPINTDAVVMAGITIDSGSSMQDLAMTSVVITPSFTLDGGAFPMSEYNDANFILRGTTNNNDEMLLGSSHFASPGPVRVINSTMVGNYDVVYRHETGEEVPQNSNALLQSNVILNSDMNFAVNDVAMVSVSGRFTLNGNNFPSNASNSVRFLLRDSSNDSDEFLFGFSDVSNEAVKLIPGTYHVIMDHLDGGAVPQNEMHEIDFSNVLSQNDATLSVNVPAVRVAPSFTLDGQAFPASIYQSARFYLRERHSPKNHIFLGESYKNNNSVMVIKEDYDVVYEHLNGEQTPQNTDRFLEVVDL